MTVPIGICSITGGALLSVPSVMPGTVVISISGSSGAGVHQSRVDLAGLVLNKASRSWPTSSSNLGDAARGLVFAWLAGAVRAVPTRGTAADASSHTVLSVQKF